MLLVHYLNTLNQPDYKLDLGKLMSLLSDGPNVNKAVWKIIDEHLKVGDLHGLLPFILCSLHVACNAFRYGFKEYGSEVDQLCLDLFYWFKQSLYKRKSFKKWNWRKSILFDMFSFGG